jgi:hypothetical protein
MFRSALRRGTVLTFAPTWLDPFGEPYRTKTGQLAASAGLEPANASWNINFGDYTNLLTSQSPQADTLNTIVADLGFTPETQWAGTASDPEGPWVGALTGYNHDDVTLNNIGASLTATTEIECRNGTCYETAADYNTLPYALYVQDGTTAWGEDARYLPDTMPTDPTKTPDDITLTGGIDLGLLQGILNSTTRAPTPPVGVIEFAINSDNTMTLWTPLGEATALSGD